MKKTVKAALFAALVCFSSTLFAAEPVSFLKGTTYNLFEDETVDNLAWGLEDADGLVLGGFIPGTAKYNFNIGAGAVLGSMWWSIYDFGSFVADQTTSQTVKLDTVAKDGINTDYTEADTTSGTSRNAANNISNELYLSFVPGDWGIQSYWKVTDTSPAGNIGKRTTHTETKATGVSTDNEYNYTKRNAVNTFGANFKGIGLAELNDADLYFQLNYFEVAWGWNKTTTKSTTTNKYANKTYNKTTTNDNSATHKLTPAFGAEMGFNLSDLGTMSTKFVLGEEFKSTLAIQNKKVVTDTVAETFNNSVATQKTTTKTTTTTKDGDGANRFTWENTLAPKFIFDFDVGERLAIKASVGADVKVSNTPGDKNGYKTTVTETTTYNELTKTTTKSYSKDVTLANAAYRDFVTDKVETKVTTATALALVYQVKPEKFNLNMGVKWNPGTFTWTASKTTRQTAKETSYAYNINEAGTKTVTTDTVTPHTYTGDTSADDTQANFTAEEKSTQFVATAAAAPELQIGASWFITEKATLDLAYEAELASISVLNVWGDSLLSSSFKIMFSVKF